MISFGFNYCIVECIPSNSCRISVCNNTIQASIPSTWDAMSFIVSMVQEKTCSDTTDGFSKFSNQMSKNYSSVLIIVHEKKGIHIEKNISQQYKLGSKNRGCPHPPLSHSLSKCLDTHTRHPSKTPPYTNFLTNSFLKATKRQN